MLVKLKAVDKASQVNNLHIIIVYHELKLPRDYKQQLRNSQFIH